MEEKIKSYVKVSLKKSSSSASAVINIENIIHTVIAKMIFSDINKFISPFHTFFFRKLKSNDVVFPSHIAFFIQIFFFVDRIIAIRAALHVGQGYCLQRSLSNLQKIGFSISNL